MNKGLIHLYTGEGKGKTTAAMGLALRAAGAGKKVLILQFMKGRDTGELHSIAHIPAIRILRSEKDFGFFSSMSQVDKEALTKIHNRLLDEAVRQVSAGEAELVCTGRDAADFIVDAADYITEMRCIRHPFEKGIPARRGVEF